MKSPLPPCAKGGLRGSSCFVVGLGLMMVWNLNQKISHESHDGQKGLLECGPDY